MSFANQVAFQMNAKLGGEPWAVKILMMNTMVIGYDTYHDTLKSGVSVGAVVASMNNSTTNYLSVANLHSNPQQELNDNMCPVIRQSLRKYHELNKEFTARIIVYRFVLDFYPHCPFVQIK